MTEYSVMGAMAAARYFHDLVNFGYRTGDPSVIDEIVHDGCIHCEPLRESIKYERVIDSYSTSAVVDAPMYHTDEDHPTKVSVEITEATDLHLWVGKHSKVIEGRSRHSQNTAFFLVDYRDGKWVPISLYTSEPIFVD